MTFKVFLPDQASSSTPALYYLSGLTCTPANFAEKCPNAFAAANELNIAIVLPDTSPRGHPEIATENDGWDFGTGAGFYVDATTADFKKNYNMYTYVTKELPSVVNAAFDLSSVKSITGHSMGGHGALTIALQNPTEYASVSAFAPICNPSNCPWGKKAFEGYLGSTSAGSNNDATNLVASGAAAGVFDDILIDQGSADDFLSR